MKDKKTTGWEIENLYELLELAQNGRKEKLNNFLKSYPLACINKNYSTLLVIRKFFLNETKSKKNIKNCAPNIGEKFQWGMTIIQIDSYGGSELNAILPNNLTYKKIQINNDEIHIETNKNTCITTSQNLLNKLHIHGDFKETDIVKNFSNLSSLEKPEVRNKINNEAPVNELKNKVLGILKYNKTLKSYSCTFNLEKEKIKILIFHLSNEETKSNVIKIEKLIKEKYYINMLLKAEKEMISLKNNTWLEKKETPMTANKFRKLITVKQIHFYADGSSHISCKDGNMFGGHSILITVSDKGKYEGAFLVG